jgi:hypothetical protein
VSRDRPYRGFGHRGSEGEVFRLREWRSRERIRTVHLRRTGGSNRGVGEVPKRSIWRTGQGLDSGLVNSEVRRVRAQELDAPSREVAKLRGARTTVGSRSREDRWIRNPIAYRAFGGSEVERSRFRLHE